MLCISRMESEVNSYIGANPTPMDVDRAVHACHSTNPDDLPTSSVVSFLNIVRVI